MKHRGIGIKHPKTTRTRTVVALRPVEKKIDPEE